MFTSVLGEISEDPLRGITNLHKRFSAAVFLQEKIRNSVSGPQAYNAYLGKHNVGKGTGGKAGGKTLPRPDSVNHFGISPSNWYKKVPVPLVYDGVVVNYVETLQKTIPEVTNLKIVPENSITVFANVSFDQKEISPGICEYQKIGFGVLPSINHEEALVLLQNGYSQMLKDLIRDFKTKTRAWIKEGEVFFLQLLDYFVAIPVAVYYLSEAGQWEDVLNRLKEAVLCVSACGECLRFAKNNNTYPQWKYFCKECFTQQKVSEEYEGLYDEWTSDCRPCESCMAAIKGGNSVKCKRFRIFLSISDQASAYEKLGKQIFSTFCHSLQKWCCVLYG